MSLLDLLLQYQEEVPLRERRRDFAMMVVVLAAFVVLVVATGYWMGVLPE
jgi:hypothetical protein